MIVIYESLSVVHSIDKMIIVGGVIKYLLKV